MRGKHQCRLLPCPSNPTQDIGLTWQKLIELGFNSKRARLVVDEPRDLQFATWRVTAVDGYDLL